MTIKSSIVISAKNRTDAAFDGVKRGLGGVASKATFAVGAVAGLAGAAGFGALVAQSFAAGDATAKAGDKIGIMTAKLGQLHHITSLFTSAGAGAMNEALTKATKRLGEFNATGGGAAAKWLEKLNLDTQQLAALSPDQLFYRYAESIRGLNTRGEKLAAISALMGDESRALIGIIDQSPEVLAEAASEADLLGITLSRIDAAKLEQANDETTRLKGIVKGAGNSFAVELAPYIAGVNQEIVKMAKEAGGFGEIAASVIDGFVTGLGFAADAVRGLQVVWQGLETLAKGVIASMLTQLDMLQQGVVDVINLIPGLDAEPIQGLATAALEARAGFEDAKVELETLAMQPMPSENFKAWAEEVKASANEAAQAVAAASPGANNGIEPPPGMEGTGGEDTEDPEITRMRDRLAKLDESLLAEKERLALHYEEKQEFLQEAFENEIITEAERDARLQALAADHEDKLTKLKNKGLSDRQKFEQMSMKQQTKFVLGELSNILAGAAQSNKTLFKINKIAGIANAIVSTSEAVAKSLAAYPYPINIGMAAASFAAGIAQVNAIRSQQFGGGGSVPSPSGGGASASASQPSAQQAVQQSLAAQSASTDGGGTTSETPALPQQTIKLDLGDEDRLLTTGAARRLIEELEETRRDMGGNVSVVF